MPTEVEIKLKVESPTRLKKRLRELGFTQTSARHFESNHLFDFPDQRLRRRGCLLRLRLEGCAVTVTFKGPPGRSRHFKVREEIETQVEKGGDVRRILESVGLQEAFCYEKFRTTYAPDPRSRPRIRAELTVDETPIGNFAELEGPRRWIDKVAALLGYTRADYITASYAGLYFARCRQLGIRPQNMIFMKY